MTNHGVTITRTAAKRGLRPRRMPKGYRYVNDEVNEYTGDLTADAEAKHGTLDRDHLETIDAATAWHRHALFVLTVLRREHDKLTPETKVQFSAEIAKAIEKRRQQVKQLDLDGKHDPNLWETYHHVNGRSLSRDADGTPVQLSKDSPNASQASVGGDSNG